MVRLVPLLLPVVVLAAACNGGALRGNVYENAVVQYRIGAPGDGWREVKVEQANVAWLNDDLGASMLVNSHCEGVQDAPLEALAGHLVIGMTEREVVNERKMELSRREAIEQELAAKLDGVPRRMMVMVLKKDGCVYDIVLDSNPETFESSRASYERVRDGFDVGARKDWS